MKRMWASLIAVAVILSVVGGLGIYTDHGRRVMRYADRRFGMTEKGRRDAFRALWTQARNQYYAAAPRQYGSFQRADYPAKARLLAQRDETVAAVERDLANEVDEPFLMDLLLSLGPEAARSILEKALRSGPCYYASAPLTAALTGSFPAEQLQQLALELPADCAQIAFRALPREAEDPTFLESLLVKHNGASGLPYWLLDNRHYPTAMAAFPRLDRAGKLSVLRIAYHRPVAESTMRGWLAAEQDPAVKQELLYLLGHTSALLAAIEQDGAFRGNSFWSNWRWMKEAAATNPDSYLARGINAYEAVRGLPYFGIDRKETDIPMWQYGNHWYDCDREIPGWQDYLTRYSRHDASDDAAYRLGRCYELTGQYDKALEALRQAMLLPDGEMAYHARLRIAWVLDVLMSEEQLRALRLENPGLRIAAAYSIAVRELRSGRYDEARKDLDALLATAEIPPLPELFPGDRQFWQDVREQRDLAARMKALSGQSDPESRYGVAAIMYHEELVFYNHLWYGSKLGYLMNFGFSVVAGDMEPAVERWAYESNHYLQAAKAFEPLEDTPGVVGDKAAYSRAMALIRATQSLTPDVPLYRPRQEINREAQRLLETFAAERTKSDLVPDALLSLGYLTGEQAYFDRVVKQYPRSDAAVTARSAKPFPRREWATVPFRYLSLAEAPPAVAEWAKSFLGKPGARSMTEGEYTYVLATTDQTGKAISAGVGPNWEGPGLVVGFSVFNDPRKTEPDFALVRFKAGGQQVILRPNL